MLNNLLLIIVMILSLSLAFYCVDSHKSNILSMVNTDEINLTKEKIVPVKPIEKVYVEVLAVEDKNKTSKTEPQITKKVKVESIKEKEIVTEIIEKTKPKKEIEPQEKIEIKEEIVKKEIKRKVESKKSIKNETVSEYGEGYKLDELEKMILEELKKGKKD